MRMELFRYIGLPVRTTVQICSQRIYSDLYLKRIRKYIVLRQEYDMRSAASQGDDVGGEKCNVINATRDVSRDKYSVDSPVEMNKCGRAGTRATSHFSDFCWR